MSAADRLRAERGVRHRYRTDRRTFERLVGEVVAALPEPFSRPLRERRRRRRGVARPRTPSRSTRSARTARRPICWASTRASRTDERQTGYNLVLPDRITIYRRPILAASRTEAEAREEIRLTVLHEIGHYFGLGDDELP